jgi:hypothetical protein
MSSCQDQKEALESAEAKHDKAFEQYNDIENLNILGELLGFFGGPAGWAIEDVTHDLLDAALQALKQASYEEQMARYDYCACITSAS